MPAASNREKDSFHIQPHIGNLLIKKLMPEDNDIIIIGSDNKNLRLAEFGAKNVSLHIIYYNGPRKARISN